MINLGKSLRAAINKLDMINAVYDAAFDQFKAQHAELIEQRNDAKAEFKTADTALREAILEYYAQTGEKPSKTFASISLNDACVVPDKTKLVVWLVNNHVELIDSLITIDDRALTKLLKSATVSAVGQMLQGIPAELIKQPVAKISKDKLPEVDTE